MKYLRIIISMVMLLIVLEDRVFAFEHDISLGDVRKIVGQTIIKDLAIGDKAYINYYSLCWDRERLYLSPYGAIIEGDKGMYEIAFTKKVGNHGILSIPIKELKRALIKISRRLSCKLWQGVRHHGVQFIEIDTINGFSRISRLLNKLYDDKARGIN